MILSRNKPVEAVQMERSGYQFGNIIRRATPTFLSEFSLKYEFAKAIECLENFPSEWLGYRNNSYVKVKSLLSSSGNIYSEFPFDEKQWAFLDFNLIPFSDYLMNYPVLNDNGDVVYLADLTKKRLSKAFPVDIKKFQEQSGFNKILQEIKESREKIIRLRDKDIGEILRSSWF